MSVRWRALAREAGVAAEHLAIGATALGRANYAEQAYYGQAFFALSIGIERSGKLALVVDHALENGGAFPDNKALRAYGHSLRILLERLDEIGERRGLRDAEDRLPQSDIHEGIIETLSEFAENITRYYNLDLVTGGSGSAQPDDPVAAWSRKVTVPIVAAHYTERHRKRDERNARGVHQLLDGIALVRHVTETGETLDAPYDAALQTAVAKFAKPYERMYVLQIARFIGAVMSELGYAAHRQRLADIPYLSEFFGRFKNSDHYLRSRKTWSIYRR